MAIYELPTAKGSFRCHFSNWTESPRVFETLMYCKEGGGGGRERAGRLLWPTQRKINARQRSALAGNKAGDSKESSGNCSGVYIDRGDDCCDGKDVLEKKGNLEVLDLK